MATVAKFLLPYGMVVEYDVRSHRWKILSSELKDHLMLNHYERKAIECMVLAMGAAGIDLSDPSVETAVRLMVEALESWSGSSSVGFVGRPENRRRP
jgi:hypothetical protein